MQPHPRPLPADSLRVSENACGGVSCPFCHAFGLWCGGAGIQSAGGRGRGENPLPVSARLPFLGYLQSPSLAKCLTSSTCRNSRKSRIRSDSRVICSKAESHTKRSRTLNGESTADQTRPCLAQLGHATSTGQGWGRGRKGTGAGPGLVL